MTFEDVRALALALPGVEDGTSYGTPALKVKGKLLARLKEDGVTLALRTPMERKELLMEAAPEVFYETPHYAGYPMVLVRLAAADPAELSALLAETWRAAAPAKLVREHDARNAPASPA